MNEILLVKSIEVKVLAIVNGRTNAESYAVSISTDYKTTPLLTVGDELPYLQGTFGNYTPDPNKNFAMPSIPDGMGVVEYQGNLGTEADDRYYVFMNSEIGTTVSQEPNTPENYIFTYFNSTKEEKIRGARVSLFEFDKNWNVIGGRNLIETATDNATGITYKLNTQTGFYENPNSPNDLTTSLNSSVDKIQGAMSRFCSGFLAESGFIDPTTGTEIPFWFAPEEDSSPTNRGWAVTANGAASSLDSLGRYQLENVVAASQYRPLSEDNTSKKTVLISTEDFKDGELYMWVGNQTADDPNGFKNGQLYVLQATNPVTGAVYGYETLPEALPVNASWTPVPKNIAQGTGDQTPAQITTQLSEYVNAVGEDGKLRSTNFRRLEDIGEDPSQPGTFYLAVTGTADKTPDDLQDNPLGKVYRLTLNANDPAATGSLENVIVGDYGTGVSYDNLTVLNNGHVLIQEDRAYNPSELGGGDIYKDEGRQAYIWEYNPTADELYSVAEMQEDAFPDLGNDPAKMGEWESSGVVQVGKSNKILFDVQAHTDTRQDPLYPEGGQLLMATYNDAEPEIVFGTLGNDDFDAATPNDNRFIGNNQDLLTGGGDDTVNVSVAPGNNSIDLAGGDDIVFAGTNNRILAGSGNDFLFLGYNSGNNVVTGGADADQFWLVTDADNLPAQANLITDFTSSEGDVIGIANTGLSFSDLAIRQTGADTTIRFLGQDIAVLLNTQTSRLTSSSFVFI